MKVNMVQPNDVLLEDLEILLREIDEFNTACGNNKPLDIPKALDNYLHYVAKSGNTVFPWPHVRSLFRTKLMNAIQEFQEPTCPNESFVLERFDLFRLAAPFTVQRLTELILQPRRHYKKKEKFLRGLEKTVLVVSTVEPRSLSDEDKNGGEGNVTISSCEEENEPSVFNRTFPIERQEVISSVRTMAIDVNQGISVDSSEGLVLDPVTSSAVSVAVINQNIGVTTEAIISESVTNSSISAIDVITPGMAIAVSSESIILDPVSDTSADIVSIESSDTVSAMECESSSTVAEVSPTSLLQCVSGQDLVPASILQTPSETLSHTESVLESVSSSLINIETVKLSGEGIPNTETVDCIPSEVTTDDPVVNLFQCVAAGVPQEPCLTAPVPSSDMISSEDPLVEPTAMESDEAEPVLVDVSPSIVNVGKNSEELKDRETVEASSSLTSLGVENESSTEQLSSTILENADATVVKSEDPVSTMAIDETIETQQCPKEAEVESKVPTEETKSEIEPASDTVVPENETVPTKENQEKSETDGNAGSNSEKITDDASGCETSNNSEVVENTA